MNLNPEQLSAHIKAESFNIVEEAIINFIVFNSKKTNSLGLATPLACPVAASLEIEMFCNNYALVIAELFCHDKYHPSKEILETMLRGKYVIEWLFSASEMETTDTIIEYLGLIIFDKNDQMTLNSAPGKIKLLLALVCLGSKYKLPWLALFKVTPAIALTAYIGLVTQAVPALSERSCAGFNHLLISAKNLPTFELPILYDLAKLAFTYFICSYATSPEKYEFKKWLTSLIRLNSHQWLDDKVKNYIASLPAYKFRQKQKIAVMLEKYSRDHAMHRCYNRLLISLSKNHELVAFIAEAEAPHADLSVFNKVVTFNSNDINLNVNLVIAEQPDVIYYPSIGMKFWGIYLSQLRLAPLQLMSCGHPSSSYSPEIDYCFMSSPAFQNKELQPFFSEKLIGTSSPFCDLVYNSKSSELTTKFINENNQYITDESGFIVGVNGVLTKVTSDIINVCKRIQQDTSKKIKFIFFSQFGQNELGFIASKKQISRELTCFELVACYSNFLEYMKTVARCHFMLPTLPFGGSNSNVDAMVLNKPKFFIRGTEQYYTRSDFCEWHKMGLDAELGCDTVDELVAKSINLIEDPLYRQQLHLKISEKCNLDNVFKKPENYEENLLSMFNNAFEDAVNGKCLDKQ